MSRPLGPRRIAIDARTIEPHMHGIGIYAHRLIQHLAHLAPDTEFLVLCAPGVGPLLAELWENVRPVQCPVRLGDPRWEESLGESWCLDHGVHLYHGTSYGCIVSDRLASVATVHDISFVTLPQFYSDEFRRHMTAELERSLRTAGRVIMVSHHVRGLVAERFVLAGDRLRTVHSGPGQFDAPVSSSQQRTHILSIDLGQPRKNVEGAVQAVARLVQDGTFGGRLQIVDRGWHVRPEVREVCERLGVLDQVEVTGELDAEAMAALYTGAVCLVYASFDEGFGFPALEAMQCGAPVVASRAGSLPEVCGDAALYVNPAEPWQIAEAVRTLLSDGELCQEMARHGRQRAACFSWERCAAETMAVYREAFRAAERGPSRAVVAATGPAPDRQAVAMVTTWGVPCGVAESTRPLVEALSEHLEVWVLSEEHGRDVEAGELPVWRRGSQLRGVVGAAVERGCGIVHVQYHPAFFYDGDALGRTLWDLKLRGIGTVVTLHEISHKPPVWTLVPDLLIAHSEAMRDLLVRHGITTPHSVIPLALSGGRPRVSAIDPEGRIVLKTVGFLHPNRGHRWGLEVLAALREDYDVQYEVVGALADGCEGYPDELRSHARALGVADRFVLKVGYVPRATLLDEWSSGAIGLLPYRYVGTGSSGALTDALAAGIPLVTSDSVFFSDAGDAVLRAGSASEMAEAVRHLVEHPDAAKRLGDARDALSRTRSPVLRVERHQRAYEQVCARQRRVRRHALSPWISVHVIAKEESQLGLDVYRSCLQSLKGYADEFVVVDNGSAKEVLSMVREELGGMPNKLVLAPDVRDFSVLRNAALNKTSPEATHIHRVDTDEVFFPGELPMLRDALRDPDIAVMHVLLVHFMIEPTRIQDVQVNRCVFRRGGRMRWRKAVHEVLEDQPPGRASFLPIRFLHFGYVRPQWQTCLKWLQYAQLEYGSLQTYRWDATDGERRRWFGNRRTPDTILEERATRPYEGKYPASCARWLEAWGRSGRTWRDYLREVVDHTPWDEWREAKAARGSWEATLEDALASAWAP